MFTVEKHQAALHGAVSLYLLTRTLLVSGLHIDSQGIFPSCCFSLGFDLLFVFMMAWVASCRSYCLSVTMPTSCLILPRQESKA